MKVELKLKIFLLIVNYGPSRKFSSTVFIHQKKQAYKISHEKCVEEKQHWLGTMLKEDPWIRFFFIEVSKAISIGSMLIAESF